MQTCAPVLSLPTGWPAGQGTQGPRAPRLAKRNIGGAAPPTKTTGKAHWYSLIRARAIENGCFVFAPAQCGTHDDGRKTYGHSLIVDPWGEVLAEAKNKPSVLTAKVDINLINDARAKIPAMTNYDF